MTYQSVPMEASTSSLSDDSQMDDGAILQSLPSVHDAVPFANRHLSDMGIPVEDFGSFSWRVNNYRTQPKRMTSPEFEVGGHKWNILLFPQGNSNGNSHGEAMVSVYLNYADDKHAKEGWHVCAQFCLAISNPGDPTCYIQSQAHHRFNHDEQDWGFTRFVELKKLYQASDNRPRPIIDEEETEITAYVRVLKDETGVLWHNFQNYDSKKETGYVGLKNQGATCYMNSLLQSLFLTSTYRRAVYQIPTEGDALESVALALQRVFYLLQTSEQSVSTNELTKSFGWKGFDSFLQHDVQEFNRVLQDKLEMKMKGTPAETCINDLFSGKATSYIRCMDVDFISDRTEPFLDLQLNVKGLRNLEEGFRDYIAEETLDGDNKYMAEGYGLQVAKKGIIFDSFPPVLHLQLKRFEYDMMRDVNVKINDRYEFPMSLDLAPYMKPEVVQESQDNWVYHLHGVLVHSGDVHGGHYWVLIKPAAEGPWFKFDDDRVTRVTDREVLEDNYGGEMLLPDGQVARVPGQLPNKPGAKRFTNAYMLVYIRESQAPEILREVTDADTPAHLRTRLDEERKEAELKKRERDEQHLYLTTKVISDSAFRKHQGFDLAAFDDRNADASDVFTFKVPKTQPFVEFKKMLLTSLQADQRGDCRLWVLVNRQNKTVRPDAPVPDDPELTMEVVRERMASKQHDLKLYLEYQKPGEMQRWSEVYPNETPIMVFVKHFSVEDQTLLGLGHFYVHKNLKVSDLANMINEHMKYPPGTQLKIYEEIKPTMIELMKQKATFHQSEIQDGDIVCFQTEMSEQQFDIDRATKSTSPVQMYDFFVNRVVINFKPRYEETDEAKQAEFELTLSKKNNYEQVAQRVGAFLDYDPAKLRFTAAGTNGLPKNVAIRRTQAANVAEMVQPSYTATPMTLLYYEMLDIPLQELESKRNVKITWMGCSNKEESQHSFLMNKTSSFHEVSDALLKAVKVGGSNGSTYGSGKIRIFNIEQGSKKLRVYSHGETIREADVNDLYAEEIPQEELSASEPSDRIITVFHYTKDPQRTHGVPFRFVLRPNEKFVDTQVRLRKRMGMHEKEFQRCKFSLLVPSSSYKQAAEISDDDVIREHRWSDDDMLGVDHIDRTTKRVGERAVFIKG